VPFGLALAVAVGLPLGILIRSRQVENFACCSPARVMIPALGRYSSSGSGSATRL
jgi:hypothetical protein